VDVLAEIEADIDFGEEEHLVGDSSTILQTLDDIDREVKRLLDSFTGGRILREGFRVAIAGRPNAGKSSLFNLLLKQERALVTPTPGTTRDYLSEWIDLGGFAVNLIDTAGLRRKGGAIEKAGQERAESIIEEADLVLWLFDISAPNWCKLLEEDRKRLDSKKLMVVGNTIDLVAEVPSDDVCDCVVSCLTGVGIDELKRRLKAEIENKMPDLTSGLVVTSARHHQQLKAAHLALGRARTKLAAKESPEIVAFELQQATRALDEITGRIYNEEILGRIFSSFCIGK
ncbi:MAG: GTP-binding protein, partial [Candidatus Zixiibacteriota bacterium]